MGLHHAAPKFLQKNWLQRLSPYAKHYHDLIWFTRNPILVVDYVVYHTLASTIPSARFSLEELVREGSLDDLPALAKGAMVSWRFIDSSGGKLDRKHLGLGL